jgi:hypothetical protein
MGNYTEPGAALLERLAGAVTRHDLDALESCFAPAFRNETPAHPAQGTAHQMAGVVLFGVSDGLFSSARFYLEPVQAAGPGPDAAVRQRVGAGVVPPDGSQP